MPHDALVKTRLSDKSPLEQFFQYILFLQRLVNAKILSINFQIKYRLVKIFVFFLLYELVNGFIGLVFVFDVDSGYAWYIRISAYVTIISAYVFLSLYHQFIYHYRPMLMNTSLFQHTATNYYKIPTLSEMITIISETINLQNLPHIDVRFLTEEIVKHCYQPSGSLV